MVLQMGKGLVLKDGDEFRPIQVKKLPHSDKPETSQNQWYKVSGKQPLFVLTAIVGFHYMRRSVWRKARIVKCDVRLKISVYRSAD